MPHLILSTNMKNKKSWSYFSLNETYNDLADLAILKVNEPFKINEFVAPVRLPKWNVSQDLSKHVFPFSCTYN